MFQRKSASVITICILSLLNMLTAGCGGGGGGSPTGATVGTTPTPAPTPAPTPTSTTSISQAKGQSLAAAAYQDIFIVSDADLLGLSSYKTYYELFQGGNTTASCANSGSVTTAVVDGGTVGIPDGGDTLSINFTNCQVPNSSAIANGVEAVTWISSSGDPTQSPYSWNAGYTITYQNLEIHDGTSKGIYSGSTTFTAAATANLATQTANVAYNGLNVQTFFNISTDVNNPVWISDNTANFNQMTSSYAVSVTADTSLEFNGPLTYTDINNAVTSTVYSTTSPVMLDQANNKIVKGGTLSYSLKDVRGVRVGPILYGSFALDAQTNCKLSIVSPTAVHLDIDTAYDGSFATSYDYVTATLK